MTIVADQVRVYFSDGTSTVTYVLGDEDIQDHIVELCENEGWSLADLTDYSIEGQIEE